MMEKPHILVLNGPNLHKLGEREPSIYGTVTLDSINAQLIQRFPEVKFTFFQSDIEGELIRALHQAGRVSGAVINAGGYTHTSVALRDAIASTEFRVIEVHVSNLLQREPFRHVSLIGAVCDGSIMGFGSDGYRMAIDHLLQAS
jgi:3-dehydroquinate dehydratase-2